MSRIILCAGVALGLLAAAPVQLRAAQYTFYESVSIDAIAVLQTSGVPPFDHTSVASLTITPVGLGYFPNLLAGAYGGSFSSSTGDVIVDISTIGLVADGLTAAEFVSSDAPDGIGGSTASLALGFGAQFFDPDYITYTLNGTDTQSFGTWINTTPIPEPASLLSSCLLVGCAACRRSRR